MLIAFNHVYKYYNKNWKALSDIHFRLEKGEFAFLTGPSGAGKTTLLKLIYMDERPDSGELLISFNQDLTYRSGETPVSKIQRLRRKLGIVFQDFKLLSDRNAYENVAFALRIAGEPIKIIKEKVYRVLADCGIAHKALSYPHEMSGGEQQRVCIARALVNDPYILIADEPTGNLDADTAKDILKILRDINASGTAVLMATHNHGLVQSLNYRNLILHQGQLQNRDLI